MKAVFLSLFLFTGACFGAKTYSQETFFSLELENETVGSVIRHIEKNSEFIFFYFNEVLDINRRVNLRVNDQPVEKILDQLFEGTDNTYTISDRQITIVRKEKERTATPVPTPGQTNQGRVTGIVKDQTGEAVIGASVVEKGTLNGTITDIDGKFTLDVQPDAVLEITYIGYIAVEIKANSNAIMNITMHEDTQALDEVVIVGFGVQKKVNLTGSVAMISGDELMERPVTNATQALQGLIPGLNIDVSNGNLGSRPDINVRGTTTIGEGTSGAPLILIDGMEADLHSVNPQDIASISVLKDVAASSIYGSRAPFGVILITTKSGSKDGKTTINYNNSFRFGNPINKKQMMNSVQFAGWVNDALTNRGNSVRFDEAYMDRLTTWRNATPYSPGQRITADGTIIYPIEAQASGQWYGGFSTGADDVDYYDIVYKDWTFSQEHNVSASGGNQKFNYYASGSFFDQEGLIRLGQENLQRFTATTKISSELTDWLRLNMNMRFIREDYIQPSMLTDNFYEKLASKAWPILPLYDPNGNYYYSDDTAVASLAEGGLDKKQTDYIYAQTGFVIEPVKNWITSIDFNYRIMSENRHWDKHMLMNHDADGNPYNRTTSSNVHEEFLKENYYNFNARTEYSFTLADKHNLHALGGIQAENLKQTLFGLQRNGIMISSKPDVDLTSGLDINGNPVTPETNGARQEWSTVGFFGRINYDYDGRYLLEVNLRTDGSSRFRKGNQWKTFPSASAGWNISREEFFEPLQNTIDMLKVRGSYGTLGNQNTDNWYYTYQTLVASAAAGEWLQNSQKTNIAKAPELVSESLTWETIESYNIGLDWALLNSRLSGSFDYYVRNTKNMVGAAPALPAILGADVPKTNNTDLRTQGWELSVMWRDALNNGLSYSAKLLLSDARTKILRYPNNPTGSLDSETYIEGRYINEIWGYETIGIAKTDEEMQRHLATLNEEGQNALGSDWRAGDIMYKDINGDGKISAGNETISDPGDKKVIGNSTPRYRFGLDLNVAWKGFDVRVFLQGVLKRDYWQGSDYFFGFTGGIKGGSEGGLWNAAGITDVADYFRDENTWSVQQGYQSANLNGYLPRPMDHNKNLQVQTRYLQNASYIRLKNLQIGYTLPTAFTSKWAIQRARIYFSGENLFTITGLAKQFDPETIGTFYGNGYPLSTTLSCGLSLTF